MSPVDYRSGRCTGNPFIMPNIMPNTDEVSNKYHLPIQMRLMHGCSHGEELLGSRAAFRARSVKEREELRPCLYNIRSKVFWEKHTIIGKKRNHPKTLILDRWKIYSASMMEWREWREKAERTNIERNVRSRTTCFSSSPCVILFPSRLS